MILAKNGLKFHSFYSALPVHRPLGYTFREKLLPGGVMVTLRILIPPFLVRVQAG